MDTGFNPLIRHQFSLKIAPAGTLVPLARSSLDGLL